MFPNPYRLVEQLWTDDHMFYPCGQQQGKKMNISFRDQYTITSSPALPRIISHPGMRLVIATEFCQDLLSSWGPKNPHEGPSFHKVHQGTTWYVLASPLINFTVVRQSTQRRRSLESYVTRPRQRIRNAFVSLNYCHRPKCQATEPVRGHHRPSASCFLVIFITTLLGHVCWTLPSKNGVPKPNCIHNYFARRPIFSSTRLSYTRRRISYHVRAFFFQIFFSLSTVLQM